MIIRGYKVQWRESGLSYARPVVRKLVEKRYWFGMKRQVWVKVFEGGPMYRAGVERMLPDEMIAWFTRTVDEYENYEKAWQAYRERKSEPVVD